MRTRFTVSSVLLAVLLFANPLIADSFLLHDGRVFQGRIVGITERGELKIATADGTVYIPQEDLKSIQRERAPVAGKTGRESTASRTDSTSPPAAEKSSLPAEKPTGKSASAGAEPSGAGWLHYTSLVVPGLPQLRAGRRRAGGTLMLGFSLSSLAAFYFFNELGLNAERANGNLAYHLYLDPAVEQRHGELTRAYQASTILAVGFYLAHGGDLFFARRAGASEALFRPLARPAVVLVIRMPLDW